MFGFLSKKVLRFTLPFLLVTAMLLCGCSHYETNGSVSEPEQNGKVFSFIFMSDTQADPDTGNYSVFGDLLALALAHESAPKLLVLGGDSVNNGSSETEWEDFWLSAGTKLDNITVISAAGNHDNKPLLAKQFDYPEKAPESSTQGFFYTFEISDLFFCVLDSNIMGAGNADDADWLRQQLLSAPAAAADWRIAVCHHPFWSAAEIPKDIERAKTMRNLFLPVMTEGNIDLLLCGHHHVYSRVTPNIGEENIFMQIMAASGSKPGYKPGDMDYITVTAQAPNYVIVEAAGNTLTITAFDGGGNPVDNVQIIK